MPGNLPIGCPLNRQTPFCGDVLALLDRPVDGRLLDPDDLCRLGLTPNQGDGALQRLDACVHRHENNRVYCQVNRNFYAKQEYVGVSVPP